MTTKPDRDELLMMQVVNGDQAAIEPLVRRYASPLLTYIHRVIGDHHCGEELFQEVFVTVWVKRHTYQFPRPFKPWLYAIAINKCRAWLRKNRNVRRPQFMNESVTDGVAVAVAPDASPVQTLVGTEKASIVKSAVDGLAIKQREVVVLRVWNGLPYAEISQMLGRSESTVRVQMHQALAVMRHKLDPCLREDD